MVRRTRSKLSFNIFFFNCREIFNDGMKQMIHLSNCRCWFMTVRITGNWIRRSRILVLIGCRSDVCRLLLWCWSLSSSLYRVRQTQKCTSGHQKRQTRGNYPWPNRVMYASSTTVCLTDDNTRHASVGNESTYEPVLGKTKMNGEKTQTVDEHTSDLKYSLF